MPSCLAQEPRPPLARKASSVPEPTGRRAWVGARAGAVPGARAPLDPNGGPEGAVRPAPRLRRRPLAPRVGPAGRRGPAAAAKAGRRGRAGRGGAEPGRSGAQGAGRPGRGRRGGKMASVGLQFQASAGDADPQSRPLLLLGQLQHLHRVPWSHVRGKLQPRVTEEVSGPRPPCARQAQAPRHRPRLARAPRQAPGSGQPQARPPVPEALALRGPACVAGLPGPSHLHPCRRAWPSRKPGGSPSRGLWPRDPLPWKLAEAQEAGFQVFEAEGPQTGLASSRRSPTRVAGPGCCRQAGVASRASPATTRFEAGLLSPF